MNGSERSLTRLCHLNYLEFLREQARWSGIYGEIVERDGLFLYATGSAFPIDSNGVVRLDSAVSADIALDAADAWFSTRQRGYTVQTSSREAVDADLIAAALERGLVAVLDSPAMLCPAPIPGPAAMEGIDLRWIRDGARVEDLVVLNDAACQSLGMPAGVIVDTVRVPELLRDPHLQTVIAYSGDEALATAQVLLSHGIAGVYYVCTREDVRGRGLGELVSRSVTNRAFELGAACVTLQASPMGEALYRRLGYEELYRYRGYARFI